MGTGSGPSGGVEEKQALIDSIQKSQLGEEQKAAYLAKAQGIQTDNFYTRGPAKFSKTVEDVTALQSEFGQIAADRDALLLQRRARLNAEFKALTENPGSKQTTNLTALAGSANGVPSLIG